MKKLAILSPLVILMASTSLAQYSCIVRPSCADMGYTKTEADCSGKTTLKCPFDLTKVSCEDDQENNTLQNDIANFFNVNNILTDKISNLFIEVGSISGSTTNRFYMAPYPFCSLADGFDADIPAATPTCYSKGNIIYSTRYNENNHSIIPIDKFRPQNKCEDGDYYYEDDTCSGFKFSSKTPIGVVIDSNKHLVAGLNIIEDQYWGFNKDDGSTENIPNVTDVTDGQTDIDFNGKENTNAIVSAYPNSEDFFANICSSLTLGGKEWYLPAEGELRTFCNKDMYIAGRILEVFRCVLEDSESDTCSSMSAYSHVLKSSTEVANSTTDHYSIKLSPGRDFKIHCTSYQSKKTSSADALCMFKY
ncbi:MAG: hypothetical protein IJV97_04000 [Alphaproteobacteria bacterium]|nr:hypothetical protein [Alphaproteobacteria bacterium]